MDTRRYAKHTRVSGAVTPEFTADMRDFLGYISDLLNEPPDDATLEGKTATIRRARGMHALHTHVATGDTPYAIVEDIAQLAEDAYMLMTERFPFFEASIHDPAHANENPDEEWAKEIATYARILAFLHKLIAQARSF